jgi:hypothetical protein
MGSTVVFSPVNSWSPFLGAKSPSSLVKRDMAYLRRRMLWEIGNAMLRAEEFRPMTVVVRVHAVDGHLSLWVMLLLVLLLRVSKERSPI